MTRRSREFFVLAFLLLSCVHTTEGQVITGSILGTVRDPTGSSVPGTTVTLVSPALLGGPALYVTNDKGQYRFTSLAPGLYRLTIEIPGFQTYIEEGLRVQVGATIERNVALALAGVTESLTVTAESPLLETKESGQSTHYGKEYVQNTPVRRYSLFDLIKSAPGMAPTRTTGSTSPGVSAFGSGVNENTYLVDGTDFTAANGVGAYPRIDTDIIAEIQIVGLGASAEYGNVPGAVFNVVTRQGGNDFGFDASYYGQSQDLTSQPVKLPCNCPEGETGFVKNLYRDLTTHLGGPVLKDRLWFFGGYQYQRDYDSQPGSDSRYPREYDADRIFWKINWQITPNLKLMHNYHDDYWLLSGPYTISRPYETGSTRDGHNPSPTLVDLTHIVSPNTFWDARVSGYYASWKGIPNSGYSRSGRVDVATGIASGGSFGFGSQEESRTVAHGKVSHYATDFLGADHDFKFGVQFVDASQHGVYGWPGGAQYLDYRGEPYLAYFREPYVLRRRCRKRRRLR